MTLVHQIWHGNSVELCQRFKPGRVDCIITDPPFGTDNQSNKSTTAEGKQFAQKIANDATPEIAMQNFKDVMDVLLPKTKADCDAYIFTSWQVLGTWITELADYMPQFGFSPSGILVWEKGYPGMGDLDAAWGMAHEFILYFKKGRRLRSDGVSRRGGVFSIPKVVNGEMVHPHEKPTALLEQFIKWSTDPGDFIVDPFGGSGSTVRAAMRTGRSAVAIELLEHNYQRAIAKMEEGEGLFG